MSQRSDLTKWLWCLFAVYVGPSWGRAVSVRTPPKNPTTIEAQAKFFQDFFSVQLSPYKIEFGHVCEDPNTWEQRYEKKDFKNHRDMGKRNATGSRSAFDRVKISAPCLAKHAANVGCTQVTSRVACPYRHLPTHEDYDQGHRSGSERHFTERHERSRPSDGLFSAKVRWGDKQGGYGEHYWDLNHAGHTGNHGNDEYDSSSDDGSYNHDLDHAHEDHDTYDEPSEQQPTYSTEEYDPEQAAKYDDSARAKRAHPRIKSDRKLVREEDTNEEPQKLQKTHRLKGRLQAAPAEQVDSKKEDEENNEPQPPKRRRRQRKPENVQEENNEKQSDVVNQKEEHNQEKRPQYYANTAEKQFVPYEQGAGVRQHHPSEITPVASAPRLFLEPTTGHVVDRATGQAYVLQPIAINNYN